MRFLINKARFQTVGRLVRLWIESNEYATLLVLAVTVGLATGIGIALFHIGIKFFNDLFYERLTLEILSPAIGAVSVVVSLATAGFIVGLIVDRFVGEERHHGVSGVIEAVAMAGGRLPFRRMPFKAVASALSLGAGASVGPEDPSVQIGSNLGSFFGARLRLSEERVRLLVAAGGASAIAAAFEAPIAGVFFALEIILNGSFTTGSISVVILAAVISSAFTQAAAVPHENLELLIYDLGGPLEVTMFVPLGLLLVPVAIGMIRFIYWQHDLWHHRIRLSRPIKTAITGAIVGVVAIFLPQIMGGGREIMNAVLSGETNYTLILLLVLGFTKIIMTGISVAGGFVGGIFAPALFVGTMLGSVYGQVIAAVGGQLGVRVSDPEAYAIAGMAGMLAGVVRSPITAIMLVFELTNDYRLILPIMMTTVVCMFLAERYGPAGMYTEGLLRKGIRLRQGRDIDMMQVVTVDEAMVTPAPSIHENASLLELRDALRVQGSLSLCVKNDVGELTGIVTLSDLQRAYDANNGSVPLTVGDICTRDVLTVYPDDVLWEAIRAMSIRDVGRLPVVEKGTHKVIGLIGRHGVMRAYNIALQRKLQDQYTEERVRLNTLTGAHVFEVLVDEGTPLCGKHIADVQWPQESVVAAIQRRGKMIIPHGSTEIRPGDTLIMVGDPDLESNLRKHVQLKR